MYISCAYRPLHSRSGSWDTSLSRAHEEIELLRREMDDLTSQIASQAISHSILQVYTPSEGGREGGGRG